MAVQKFRMQGSLVSDHVQDYPLTGNTYDMVMRLVHGQLADLKECFEKEGGTIRDQNGVSSKTRKSA